MLDERTASCRLLRRVSPKLNLLTDFGFGVLGTLWFACAARPLSNEK
jgi:hypothetical protein